MDYFDTMNKESVKIEIAIEGDESPEIYQTNDLSARCNPPFSDIIMNAQQRLDTMNQSSPKLVEGIKIVDDFEFVETPKPAQTDDTERNIIVKFCEPK